jgi:hypothetical protein
MKLEPGTAYRLDRRRFFQAAAGTAAAAGATGTLAWPSASAASDDDRRNVVPPTPIPGGLQFPGVPFIHVFVPGDPSITLPFTGITLQGFDVEPSTFTDRRGFTALAYHVGTRRAATGRRTTSRPTFALTRARTSTRPVSGASARSPSSEWICSSPVRARR